MANRKTREVPVGKKVGGKKKARKKKVVPKKPDPTPCMNVGTKYVPEQEIPLGSQRCSLMAHPNFIQDCPREVVVIPAHFTTTPKEGFKVDRTSTRVQPKKYQIRCVVTFRNNLVTGKCERIGSGTNSGPTLPNYSEDQCE